MTKAKSKAKRPVTLRPLWQSVRVLSCPDGSMLVKPRWTKKIGPNPGMMTRLAAADRLEQLINAHLRRRKLP